jgi:hypothetical protein
VNPGGGKLIAIESDSLVVESLWPWRRSEIFNLDLQDGSAYPDDAGVGFLWLLGCTILPIIAFRLVVPLFLVLVTRSNTRVYRFAGTLLQVSMNFSHSAFLMVVKSHRCGEIAGSRCQTGWSQINLYT